MVPPNAAFSARADAVPDRGRLGVVTTATDDNRRLRQIVIASVLLRAAWALLQGGRVAALPGVADQVSYHELALRLADGHGFTFGAAWWPATAAGAPTAHWSFLYVIVLAASYVLFGPAPLVVRLLQSVVVGILQPVLTYRIAARLFGRRVALVAAALAAGYAYFVYYAGTLMTESLYVVAILWAIDIAQQLARFSTRAHEDARMWLQLGLALATAVLLRQLVLLMVPVVLGWIIWHRVRIQRHGRHRRQVGSMRGALLAITVILLAMAPWTIRNYRAFGQFVPLNTNAGFVLFWGNHPVHGTRFIPILPGDGSAYGQLIPTELRDLNEAQLDRALLRRGLGFVFADPVRYLRLSITRIKEYVRFWPTVGGGFASQAARAVSFGLCLPLFACGIVLALRTYRQSPTSARSSDTDPMLALAFAAGYSLIHVLTWTLVRYRLPVDAVLMPFAALALVRIYDLLRIRLVVFGKGLV